MLPCGGVGVRKTNNTHQDLMNAVENATIAEIMKVNTVSKKSSKDTNITKQTEIKRIY